MINLPANAVEYIGANAHFLNNYKGSSEAVTNQFLDGRIRDDWKSLEPVIPNAANSVLDIGSSVGAADVLIFRHLEKSNPRIVLVDKAIKRVNGIHYNVRDIALDLQVTNGVPAENVEFYDVSEVEVRLVEDEPQFDVILSLRGLGYLFPYPTYREVIMEKLSEDGVLILDLRTAEAFERDPDVKSFFEENGIQSAVHQLEDVLRDFSIEKTVMKNRNFSRLLLRKKK